MNRARYERAPSLAGKAFHKFRERAGLQLALCKGPANGGWEFEYAAADGSSATATVHGRIDAEPGDLVAVSRLDRVTLAEIEDKLDIHAGTVTDVRIHSETDLHLMETRVVVDGQARTLVATGLVDTPDHPEPEELVGRHFVVVLNAEEKPFAALGSASQGMYFGAEDRTRIGLLALRMPEAIRRLEPSRLQWRRSDDGAIALLGRSYARRTIPATLAFGAFPPGWPLQ